MYEVLFRCYHALSHKDTNFAVDLSRFQIIEDADLIGESVWKEVNSWGMFEKDTLGKQMVRAADSISANLSEAFGRYSIPDRKRFAHIARGSLCETINWLSKSIERNLVNKETGQVLMMDLENLSIRLNAYIKSMNNHPENKK
jgi:four helix bundle protein